MTTAPPRPAVLQLYNLLGAVTERTMLDVPRGLAARGWPLRFAYETRAAECPPLDAPCVALPRVHITPTADVDAQMDALAAAATDPARAELLRQPIGLVHGHFGPRLLHALPWLVRGTPVLISLYGYDASRLLRDPAWKRRYAWAARAGARFAVLSDAMAGTLADCGVPPSHVHVIRLGIDLDHWTCRPTPGPDPPRFVFVGRLTPKKAPLDAVRAVAAIPGARLDLIGDGELEADVRAHLTTHGLADRIRLLGRQPLETLPARLDDATALVLPSVTAPDGDAEGMPMTLMQAAARGLPCVTTAHAGNPETLAPAHRQACVVPEHDVPALTRALKALMAKSPTARRAHQQAGREHIEAHFRLSTTLDAYEALYVRLTAPCNPAANPP